MKKILYIIPRFTFGGAEILLLHTVTELQKTGEYEIVVAAVRAGGELESKFIEAGAKTFVASRGGIIFGALFTWLRLRSFVRKFAPEIIHSHVFSADFITAFLPRGSRRARWISTQHNGRDLYSSFRRAVLRFVLRRVNLVVAVAGTVRDFCVKDLQVPSEKVVLIMNGIPTEQYLCTTPPRLTQPFKLITVGRLTAQKNQAMLLRALADLKSYDWVLDIFGEGAKLLELEFLAQRLKISERVNFRGNSSNINQMFCGADLVFQTSNFEGMALAVMEAMVSGRVVIATRAAGEGIIRDGVDGVIVENNDVVGLRNVIVEFFESPEQFKFLALNASKNFDKFSFAHTFVALKNIYDQAK